MSHRLRELVAQSRNLSIIFLTIPVLCIRGYHARTHCQALNCGGARIFPLIASCHQSRRNLGVQCRDCSTCPTFVDGTTTCNIQFSYVYVHQTQFYCLTTDIEHISLLDEHEHCVTVLSICRYALSCTNLLLNGIYKLKIKLNSSATFEISNQWMRLHPPACALHMRA